MARPRLATADKNFPAYRKETLTLSDIDQPRTLLVRVLKSILNRQVKSSSKIHYWYVSAKRVTVRGETPSKELGHTTNYKTVMAVHVTPLDASCGGSGRRSPPPIAVGGVNRIALTTIIRSLHRKSARTAAKSGVILLKTCTHHAQSAT